MQWLPLGFAHGFLVLSSTADLLRPIILVQISPGLRNFIEAITVSLRHGGRE